MYNTCYAGTNTRTGCGNCGGWNWFGNACGTQRVCRDCCGNLRVQNVTGCCCHRCNQCQCNGTGNDTGTAGNGNGTGTNGGFRCITICGANNTTQTTAGVDYGEAYYAQQYGLGGGCCNRCGYNWYE